MKKNKNMSGKFTVRSFFKNFLAEHPVLFVFLVLSIAGAALSGLLPSYALRYLIDNAVESMRAEGKVETGPLLLVSLLYFGAYLAVALCTFFENYMIDTVGQKIIRELRYLMMDKSHRLASSYFTNNGNGEMTSRVTDDVYAIETLFQSGLVSLAVNFLKIIGIVVSIFTFSWMLGLLLLAVIPLIYVITRFFTKRMLKVHTDVRKITNDENNCVSESIDSHLTVKNLDKEQYREDEYKSLLLRYYRTWDKASVFDSVYSPLVQLLKAVLVAAMAVLVGYGAEKGNVTLALGISAGTFAASMKMVADVFSPIEQIGQELEGMQEGVSGIVRVEAFMNEEEVKPKNPEYTAERVLARTEKDFLKISHLTFRYEDGEHDIYKDADYTVHPDEKITFVGRTGAGKTTLFRLMLGILEPDGGEIDVNGYDVSLIPDSEKRKIFGYVEQGFQSVPGSVRDQITLKDPSVTDGQVVEAMKAVFLDSYVKERIPGGYDAPYDDRLFSRGQKQLLSLARALLYNPPFLLLDEISANLDSKTEEEIVSALGNASRKRTVLSISHRISDRLGFDKTVEIADGKAVERK